MHEYLWLVPKRITKYCCWTFWWAVAGGIVMFPACIALTSGGHNSLTHSHTHTLTHAHNTLEHTQCQEQHLFVRLCLLYINCERTLLVGFPFFQFACVESALNAFNTKSFKEKLLRTRNANTSSSAFIVLSCFHIPYKNDYSAA